MQVFGDHKYVANAKLQYVLLSLYRTGRTVELVLTLRYNTQSVSIDIFVYVSLNTVSYR